MFFFCFEKDGDCSQKDSIYGEGLGEIREIVRVEKRVLGTLDLLNLLLLNDRVAI